MTLASGTKLGRYEIRSKIGEGGMGEVYLAEDTELGRTVALKVLPAEVALEEHRMHRFIQEAKTASALNHPNILTIFEIGHADATHFIAAEYIDGETLRQHIRGARMKLSEMLDVAIQTADALSAAHEAGIIHRDIKPENIMLRRRDAYVKVLDFGLAKLIEQQPAIVDTESPTKPLFKTEEGVVMGTVTYMSPEQARGLEVDARTDIWSLGVVLYEMVAGCLPFEGSTAGEILASLLNEKEPPPLARFAREVPAELERMVSKALRKNRDERYQTINDMLLDLRSLKQELVFSAKLEHSAPPAKVGGPTSTEVALATADVPATQLTSSAAYIVSGIKQHKRSVTIAVAVLLLAVLGLGYWFFVRIPSRATQIESLAVLPFVNESGNAEVEYLSDGMTESLISSLSQLPDLLVKARSSVFSYKGRDVKPQQVAAELSVQAILNGRFVLRDDDLTFYLSLVDARDGNLIWSKRYNRKLTDLISLQSEIALDVSNRLRVKLSGVEEQKLAKKYTENAEAYQLYFKGRYFWNKRTREGFEKAIEFFQQAIDRDPRFALAYAGLGDTYALMGQRSLVEPHEAYPKASAAVSRALEIDDTLSEAHVSLAFVKAQYEFDWLGAEREYKRSLEINPGNAYAHAWFGMLLIQRARFDEALLALKRAQEIDPLSPSTEIYLGWNHYYAGRYDEAIVHGGKALEMDSNFRTAYRIIGSSYEQKGMNDEAVANYLKAFDQVENLKEVYAASGMRGFWRRRVELLTEASRKRYISAYSIAEVHATLGENEQALTWLQKAYEERAGDLAFIKVNRRLDDLRSDPRFQDLLRRVGFPP